MSNAVGKLRGQTFVLGEHHFFVVRIYRTKNASGVAGEAFTLGVCDGPVEHNKWTPGCRCKGYRNPRVSGSKFARGNRRDGVRGTIHGFREVEIRGEGELLYLSHLHPVAPACGDVRK